MTEAPALLAEPMVAVFDLARDPGGQDVFAFLVLAEMARRKCGFECIHVILIAEEGGTDAVPRAAAVSAAFMLMPSVRGLSLCQSQSEANVIISRFGNERFPSELLPANLQTATADTLPSFVSVLERQNAAGLPPPAFVTPRQAVEYVKAWTEAVVGARHLVTIAPMIDGVSAEDGERGLVWTRFIESLDLSVYCPVVVGDDCGLEASLPGRLARLPVFPGAGPFSPLRFALYKQARVNLFEGRDSLGLCRAATEIPCIGFALPSGTVPASSGPARRFFSEPLSWPALPEVFRDVDSKIAAGAGFGGSTAPFRSEVMSVKGFFRRALALQAKGGAGRAQAVTICRAILKSQPRHDGALGLLGINALCAGSLDDAVELLRLAVEIAADEPAHYYNLANALTAQGRLEDAAAAYKSVILIDPEFEEAWESLGANYQARNRFAEAAECYGHLLKAGRRSTRLLFDHAHCLAALGRHEDAVQSYLAAGTRYLARQDEHECANVMSGGYDRRIYAPRNARFLST